MVKAVIWDFGGVFTTSPFEAFARFERERGLPEDLIRKINSTNYLDNAWAKFERSDVDMDEFDELFAQEAKALGHEVRGREIIALLSGDVRPEMLAALRTIKAKGLRVSCITNNVSAGEGAGMASTSEKAKAVQEIMDEFEFIIESSKAGVRKPHPKIYEMALEELGVAAADAVYLDDLGINCKAAHQVGMKAIKVSGADQALADLEEVVGFALR
ncbi:hydrolase, haloacid dehalogenase-like family [Candidatus Phaeomarinobacter ectocarpi]|uniref:Hydrolase, haloacid dehalogenase-like family n=1 Tax=Candidatus Phaeomarinibacter ectocarpi TaxID=1458461 RepID=X5MBJ8_9HYPH|nr:HAD-IA family hydrolase [Candidatus Phaeomarinobacter ectocarpi]CDO58242.1 hydrolase, haloacid dehalogenase-like family [Candidatus Phaeomarinobacter ectocarpi]